MRWWEMDATWIGFFLQIFYCLVLTGIALALALEVQSLQQYNPGLPREFYELVFGAMKIQHGAIAALGWIYFYERLDALKKFDIIQK